MCRALMAKGWTVLAHVRREEQGRELAIAVADIVTADLESRGDGWAVAEVAVEMLRVVPAHPAEGRELEILDAPPRPGPCGPVDEFAAGHLDRVEDHLGAHAHAHARRDPPPHDHATECVDDEADVGDTCPGRHEGEDRHPEPVRGGDGELPPHQVRMPCRRWIRSCRLDPLRPSRALDPSSTHQPTGLVPTDLYVLGGASSGQLGPHSPDHPHRGGLLLGRVATRRRLPDRPFSRHNPIVVSKVRSLHQTEGASVEPVRGQKVSVARPAGREQPTSEYSWLRSTIGRDLPGPRSGAPLPASPEGRRA